MSYDALEPDVPMQANTFRRFVQETVRGLQYIRAYWGRRLYGFVHGLIPDAFAEAGQQAFFQRLPGHPQQAPDSLAQVGADRQLFRFRGETDANWLTRIQAAWDDYEQGGTPQQVLKAVNQWGMAGWPSTWDVGNVTLVESGDPADFSFILTIEFGNIDPPWIAETYGSGDFYGDIGFVYGLSQSVDLAMLVYTVKKWKATRSKCFLRIYFDVSNYVQIII